MKVNEYFNPYMCIDKQIDDRKMWNFSDILMIKNEKKIPRNFARFPHFLAVARFLECWNEISIDLSVNIRNLINQFTRPGLCQKKIDDHVKFCIVQKYYPDTDISPTYAKLRFLVDRGIVYLRT